MLKKQKINNMAYKTCEDCGSKVLSEWIERKLKYKRSKRQVPFCPTCDEELDDLQLINESDSCKCGTWSATFSGKMSFRRN